MMDYIASYEHKSCQIIVCSVVHSVNQAKLYRHYKLRRISRIVANSEGVDRLHGILDYIIVASELDTTGMSIDEIIPTYNALLDLNEDVALLPWQTHFREQEESEDNAEYEGRELAIIVDMIARAYGWSEAEIFNLNPQAAACYVQEIQLEDWNSAEFNYVLSEIAYDEKGHYKPYPELSWHRKMVGPTVEEAKKVKMPARFVPDGVIIDNENSQD